MGVLAALLFACGTKSPAPPMPDAKNPYPTSTSCCGCCVWCCSCCCSISMFIFGGICVAIAVPFSGLCLVIDDLNSDMLNSYGPALGMNFSSPDFEQTVGFLDTCISKAGDRDLLSAVYVEAVNE